MNDTTALNDDIQFTVRGQLGLVTLNRPKALNTLTHDMCVRMDAQMRAWQGDPQVAAVVVTAAGERAFCAGGDVRAIYDAGPGAPLTRAFFWDEYRLNRLLFRYPKPYIALADGITMGGGVGLSAPARFRVVTERTLFAMPETAIGLFPDVGGSYYLSRCPGQTGVYLGLVGQRVKAADLLYAGLYTHHVPSARRADLLQALESDAAEKAITDRATPPEGESLLAQRRAQIDRCFAGDTIEAIGDALRADGSDWARETLAVLDRVSPLSLRITLRQIREGARRDFEHCMQMEYRLVQRFMAAHDFFAGVRAVLVDKDNRPRWQPASLAEATPAMVDRYFAPLTDRDELRFDETERNR